MSKDKSIIKYSLFKLFNFTENIGNRALYLSGNRSCVLFITMVLMLVGTVFSARTNPVLGIIFFIVAYFLIFIINAHKTLLSVWGFMTLGYLYWCVIAGLIYLLLSKIASVTSGLIAYVIFVITWCLYSLFANNKVAMLANQIHSTILVLIVLSKDMIYGIIPSEVLEYTQLNGETFETELERAFLFIFSPFLAANLIALFLCMLKGYWIEKYNNNKDVGQDGMDVKYEIEKLKEQNKQMSEQIDQLKEQVKIEIK